MQKIIVEFDIQSSDSNQSFTVDGTLENNTISFLDPTNHTNKIQLFEHSISFQKVGETTLIMELDPKSLTEATYQVYEQTFRFQVQTHILIVEPEFIEVYYQLLQDDEVLNETSFTIRYQIQKEDESWQKNYH